MNFIKSFFASCLGSLVALFLFIILCIFMLSVITSENKVTVEKNSILYLKFDAPIVEQEVDDPFAELIQQAAQPIGLMQIKEALAYAQSDPGIEGIYLNVDNMMAGVSTIAEIRQSLIDFKSSGKWIVAYASSYSEGAYYLASAADKVFLNPEGQVELNGLSIEVMFFKRMFDKLEIRPEIFRVGQFKSAVEPFMRESLSEENRLQLNDMIQGMYGHMLEGIAASRKIPKAKLEELANTMLVRNAQQAVDQGLVDSLYYDDQIQDELRGRVGLSDNQKVPLVKYNTYKKSISHYSSSKNEIAVIIADGEILPGKADQGVVGSETIVREIRRARTSDQVKAIVIRVNSPGGAFQAADEMWREVKLATEVKPVIASMSDYAASGGYYLAMACDTIVAQPTTITGSIGIFSVLFDLSQFLGNKIGITTEQVKTGEVGGLVTFTRPLSDLEKSIWQQQTESIYETFTGKAAEGRGMPVEDIKKIASGRVWTGDEAKDNGLVDILGGYNDAIRVAAEAAGIGVDYKIRWYPRQKTFLEKLTGDIESQVSTSRLQRELGEAYPLYQRWEKVKHYQGVQARMPFEFKIN